MGKAHLKALLHLGCIDTLMVRCYQRYRGICLGDAEEGHSSCRPFRVDPQEDSVQPSQQPEFDEEPWIRVPGRDKVLKDAQAMIIMALTMQLEGPENWKYGHAFMA